MATSSLLLLRRCLWYRHTRWPTSSSMILLRYSGRRFVTTVVVSSQGYVEYGAPSTLRWNKNMLLSLRASYHHNTIAMALPSPPLNDIYVCLPRGYVFWPMWCMVLHSSQWYIWYVCIQNSKFYQPPTRTIFCISTTLSPIQWLPMTEILIYDICAALVGWGTSVVLSVSMKMGYIVWFGTHITINSIGMKMGEPPDPTIYSWMSHWKYSMTMPTCEY